MSYADQRKFGIDTTRDYLAADKTLGTSDKIKILKQLDDLERLQPDNCAGVK